VANVFAMLRHQFLVLQRQLGPGRIRSRPARPGRPRTVRSIRGLVLRLVRAWGLRHDLAADLALPDPAEGLLMSQD
jgi:hypothetical protein